MKSLYLIFTFTLIFYTSLIEAQGITVIPSAPPEAQVVSTNNLYQWQGFQDVEILPGHDNKAYVLFAIRHGRGPVWGYPQNTVGLWYGYIDRNVRWYSGGVKKELRDHLHASHNLYLQGLSNATANVITACQDHEKQYHIFIGLSDASDANHPTRLVYLKWAHEHIVTTKVSNILADNIRPRMQCIADPMNNIHIFGLPQWYRNETQDSKIAAYKITPVEQNSPDKFLHLTPTMLPDTFKTGLFTIYPSHR
ncbi:MAG: hypothetical protein HYW85_06195 [Deltaproteobacteria bacterium]|nr:hypothetical protein [Deltaproteobacteria bacterium]